MMGGRGSLLLFVAVGGAAVVAGCGAVDSRSSPSASGSTVSRGSMSSDITVAARSESSAGASTSAPTSGPAAGQWQIMIEVDDMPGGGRVPPQTMSMCSTAEDKRQWQDMVGGKASAGCTVKNYSATGPTIRYAMQCANGIEGAATITIIDDDNYRGESSLTLRSGAGTQPAVIKTRMTGKRVARMCTK